MLAQIERAFSDRSESEERLRHFLADASHELRTPLSSIRGYAELFRLGAADDPATLERAMTRIEAEAARMGVLVEDLLLLAQLDQMPRRAASAVDLQRARRARRRRRPRRRARARDHARAPINRSRCWAIRTVSASCWPTCCATRSSTRRPPRPIELSIRAERGGAVLEVRDHGPGLPPEAGDQVFERFWRTEGGAARGRGGAGLGLAIVRAIVVAHGGRCAPECAGRRRRVPSRAATRGAREH